MECESGGLSNWRSFPVFDKVVLVHSEILKFVDAVSIEARVVVAVAVGAVPSAAVDAVPVVDVGVVAAVGSDVAAAVSPNSGSVAIDFVAVAVSTAAVVLLLTLGCPVQAVEILDPIVLGYNAGESSCLVVGGCWLMVVFVHVSAGAFPLLMGSR